MTKIAFLGAGNIAQAIMGGLIDNGFDPSAITACDPVPECTDRASERGISIAASNDEAIASADVVMLCVKPNIITDLLAAIDVDLGDKMLISVAAGITTDTIGGCVPPGTAIVRCMPNTPALVREGMTAMYATPGVSAAQKETADSILSAVGRALWVDSEDSLDAVTAVSGSGPAYFFLLMESMIAAAESEGLSPDVARELVLQTALGAAQMASESDQDPGTLRVQVTSPGGTTQAALEHFEAAGFADTVRDAVERARIRSVELSGTD